MRYPLVTALLLGSLGCGGGGGGGDDAPLDGAAGECSESLDACEGEQVCLDSACVPAFGRYYELRDVMVALPALDPDGQPWDADSSAPDIFIEVSSSGVPAPSSTTHPDSFTAIFSGPFRVQPLTGGYLEVRAYEEDNGSDQIAITCRIDPLTVELLRSRSIGCHDATGDIDLTIQPLAETP